MSNLLDFWGLQFGVDAYFVISYVNDGKGESKGDFFAILFSYDNGRIFDNGDKACVLGQKIKGSC